MWRIRAAWLAFRYFAGFVALNVIGVTQIVYGWAGDALWVRILYPAACFVMSLVCLGIAAIIVRRFRDGAYSDDDE